MTRFCWFSRGPSVTRWSKVHTFALGEKVALCGQALPALYGRRIADLDPRSGGLIHVTDCGPVGTDVCRICERIAARLT